MNINLKLKNKVLFIHTGIGFLLASVLPYIIDIVRFFLKIDKPKSNNIFLNIFLYVLIGPIIEELLFRKRLLDFLKKINKKNWFLFLSPFAFTLNHPFIMNSFIYSLFIFFNFYFFSFLLLSLPYYFTDCLEIAIINHALYNFNILIVLFINERMVIENLRTIIFIFVILLITYLFLLRFIIKLPFFVEGSNLNLRQDGLRH